MEVTMLSQVCGIPCPQWLWWEVRYVCLSFFLPPHNVYVNWNFFHSSLISSPGIQLPLIRSVDDVVAFFYEIPTQLGRGLLNKNQFWADGPSAIRFPLCAVLWNLRVICFWFRRSATWRWDGIFCSSKVWLEGAILSLVKIHEAIKVWEMWWCWRFVAVLQRKLLNWPWSQWEFLNMTNTWNEFLQCQGVSRILLSLKLGRTGTFLA